MSSGRVCGGINVRPHYRRPGPQRGKDDAGIPNGARSYIQAPAGYNHGRSPSEIAHHTLNASYPHPARGGVLKLSTRKFHIAPSAEKCFPLGDWRGFLHD